MAETIERVTDEDAERAQRQSRTLTGVSRDGAPGKRTLTGGLEGPDPKKGVKNYNWKGSASTGKPPAGDAKAGETKAGQPKAAETQREEGHQIGFEKKHEVFDPKRVPGVVKKGADLVAEASVPDWTLVEYDTGEHSGAVVDKRTTEFGKPDGIHGTASGELLTGSAHAGASAKIEDGGFHIVGNAGARATIAGGTVHVATPDKSFTLFGEKVIARLAFDASADAFAGADTKASVNLGVTEAGLEASISGFAGAKAIGSVVGELRWARRPSKDYARRIARNGLFQQTFGHLIPDVLESVAEAAVEPIVEALIDRMLSGGEADALVLGVTASGEASAGIGASAAFSAGMRGGVLYCSGRAGFTLGLGAGYDVNLALGYRDGLAMVALMALTGAGFLGDDLKPASNWTDYVGEAIRNYIADRSLFKFAKERTEYLFERAREFGDPDGVHGKGVIRGGGLTVYADGRVEIAEGGLHVVGNAGAKATLVDGMVEIIVPDKSFTIFGEQLLGGAAFRVTAGVFASAKAGVVADVDLRGAAMQANISGFAGAQAVANAEGTLKWARKSNQEYARMIVQKGILQRLLGSELSGVGLVTNFLETQLQHALDSIMSDAEPHPLVLGVSLMGQASAGVGAQASFSASMRGGVIRCSGSAGLTLGVGAGYNFDVTIGMYDGLAMLAMMLLNGLDLSANLQPDRPVGEFIKDQIVDYILGRDQKPALPAPKPEAQAPAPQQADLESDHRGIGTRMLDRVRGRRAESQDARRDASHAAAPEAAADQPVSSGTVIFEDWSGDSEPEAEATVNNRKQTAPPATGGPTMLGPSNASTTRESAPASAAAHDKPRRKKGRKPQNQPSSVSWSSTTEEQRDRMAELGTIVAAGESKGNYNAYNTGTKKVLNKKGQWVDKVAHSGVKANLTSMTVDEILEASKLDPDNLDRVFAAGKYQVIPKTLREAKADLGLTGDEVFDIDLQERIFFEYLLGNKRPKIRDYIRNGEGTSEDATYSAAKEWASIEVPAGRPIKSGRISDGTLSYYESGANHAHRGSAAKVKRALENAREAFARVQSGEAPLTRPERLVSPDLE